MRAGPVIVITAAALLGAASYLLFFASSPPPQGFDVSDAFARGICSSDAVLTLEETTVLARADGDIMAVLPKQSPVYLCEEQDGYITIVFPQNGSPADCSIREEDPCIAGVVSAPFETITLG